MPQRNPVFVLASIAVAMITPASDAQLTYLPHQVIQPAPTHVDSEYLGQSLGAGAGRFVAADVVDIFQYEWNSASGIWTEASPPLANQDTYSIDMTNQRAAFDDESGAVRIIGLPSPVSIPFGNGLRDVAYAGTTLAVSFSTNLMLPIEVYSVPLDGTPPFFVESISAPPAAVQGFGTQLDLSDDGQYLAVGAPGFPNETGHVYVYKYTQGSLDHLWADYSDVELDNRFGRAVALNEDGSLLAVGAPYEDQGNGGTPEDLGAVFMYDNANSNPNPLAVFGGSSAGAHLGTAIAIRGRTVLAGEPFYDFEFPPVTTIFDTGRAVVFEEDPQWLVSAYLSGEFEEGQLLGLGLGWTDEGIALVAAESRNFDASNTDRGAIFSYRLSLVFSDGFETGDTSAW